MRHYIQYHNPDRFGPAQIPKEGQPFWIMTRKKPDRLPGSCVWLVSGEGRPRRYFLSKVFFVDRWQPVQDPDFFYQVIGSRGVYFQPPLELTGYPWFELMKHHLANFSLGLTEITHTYARYFLSLAQNLSPAYHQAEKEGWFVQNIVLHSDCIGDAFFDDPITIIHRHERRKIPEVFEIRKSKEPEREVSSLTSLRFSRVRFRLTGSASRSGS